GHFSAEFGIGFCLGSLESQSSLIRLGLFVLEILRK
ncbi:unnamed protein product, partial [marine sediment metagenome]